MQNFQHMHFRRSSEGQPDERSGQRGRYLHRHTRTFDRLFGAQCDELETLHVSGLGRSWQNAGKLFSTGDSRCEHRLTWGLFAGHGLRATNQENHVANPRRSSGSHVQRHMAEGSEESRWRIFERLCSNQHRIIESFSKSQHLTGKCLTHASISSF